MSEQDKSSTEFSQFVESVKSKIPIDELYTKYTGEQFSKEDSRFRAKVVWREDHSPSLTYVPDKNLLTDFTEQVEGSDKAGRSYNVLDILQKVAGAINFAHALQMACEISGTEFPDHFKKKSNKELGHLPYNVGIKLKEVWEACQKNLQYYIDNPSKRPISLVKFCEDRNIPFEAEFLIPMNLGILPSYAEIFNILKGQGILRKGKDNKELNIYREELGNNALVFPLYNTDGGLCGLRFRQLDKKDFGEWIPVGHICFYNGQRFRNRTRNRRIMIVEGEMNLVSYGIAVYKHLKKIGNEDIRNVLDESLKIIFATGSKTNSTTIFKDQISQVFYLQDHDISKLDEDTNPKDHPILKTCARVAKEISADDIVIADWEVLSYVKPKFDLEDYLKYNEYDLRSIALIEQISIPRYAINAIKKYCDTIKNEDVRREIQIKYIVTVSDMLQYAQKEVFKEIAKKEFAISEDVQENVVSQHREVNVGPYTIDTLGRIVKTTVDEHGGRSVTLGTNFFMRILDETTYFNPMHNTTEKFYNVEVVVNGKSVGTQEVESTDIMDQKRMQGVLATVASIPDLTYFQTSLRFKEFPVITALMQTIPVNNKSYIFPSLGRPYEDFCTKHFRSENFCLFPKVSVINGSIKQNDSFQVSLSGRNSLVDSLPFEFTILDNEDYKKALSLFWYNLRHVHDSNIIDSILGMIFDSCTRELQGFGIVDNTHGFPIFLAGQSGAFKTTAAIMGMSLLGKFKNQNDLLAWNGTALSLEHQLIKVGSVTHTVDDMKVEEMNSKEFISLFHSIYGGTTRARMNQSATEMRGANKLACSLIITAEAENQDAPESIAARMLTLRVKRCSREIAEEREVHYRRIMEFHNEDCLNIDLMRGVTPRAIAWAQKRGIAPYAASLKKWKTIYKKILDDNGHRNNSERPSDMVARLVAAFEQLCEFMKFEGVAAELEINAAFENFVEYWKKEIRKQMVRIEKQSSTHKVVDLLCQLIFSESIGIRVFENDRWRDPKRTFNGYPIRDITYPDGVGRKLIIVSLASVIKQMNAQQANNSTPIISGKFTEDLKESGIIEMEGGKPKLYPIPDDNNKINWKRPNPGSLAIDYNKLMEAYHRIKND